MPITKLPAKEVQDMLGVEDLEIVAHGYTPSMNHEGPWTVDIWFEKGQLVRYEFKGEHGRPGFKDRAQRSDHFDPDFLRCNIKRWYRGKPERGFNQKLATLLATFGDEPSLVDGGAY